MDILKTLDDEEIDEMTPLKTERTDEGDETLEYQFIDLKVMRMIFRSLGVKTGIVSLIECF